MRGSFNHIFRLLFTFKSFYFCRKYFSDMKIIHTFLFAALCIVFLFAGCKKDDEIDKLPPATASGFGIYGCLLNGKAWPMGAKGYHMPEVYYENGVLRVDYVIKDDLLSSFEREWVSVRTDRIHSPGVYFINYNESNNEFCSVKFNELLYSSASMSNKNGLGYIQITRLDSINHFVSGTFEFSLLDMTGTSTMRVSKGRFDFRYP
jgi:hypothetical protein